MSLSVTVDDLKCLSFGDRINEGHRHLPIFKDDGMSDEGLECIGCLHCYTVCPQGAILVARATSELLHN